MISVIIPTYQHGNTILNTLETIFYQTYQNFEVIIVNDGSTDDTKKKLEKTEKRWPGRIKIINQERKGANSARNRGFQEAKGDFLFFCDADVELKNDCLEKMVKILKEHPEASYAYSSFKFGWKVFPSFDFDSERLKKMPYISMMSLIRREHFPGFDESLTKFQDWDLWLTMLEKGYRGIRIPEILFTVKPRKIGLSSWLPSFLYRLPWHIFPFKILKPKAIKNYEEGLKIIKKKHSLL
ncbi:MAG: glycosyltransferase family 2 protein [Patescibacteria group bacterium]|nr:glycosyltransferase family 2 protein [Patescibacteria group bacterium]